MKGYKYLVTVVDFYLDWAHCLAVNDGVMDDNWCGIYQGTEVLTLLKSEMYKDCKIRLLKSVPNLKNGDASIASCSFGVNSYIIYKYNDLTKLRLKLSIVYQSSLF